ncbi:hypothetical protein IU487_22485 [Nocardia puris]|uniref:hypothetical protein n=1 Tax=Nocardia puris TaxID=208602 RepID=UPI001893D0CB|nr:hypothetical protein [Nocardia puris]MBF6213789.1 hypothetical protein [Nocardia puris]
MAELPPLKYGRVVGRFLANIVDGPDIGDLPEFPPLQGTLTFTAGAPKVLVAGADPDPATYVQLPQHYKVSLDEFGYITWRGQRGVRLVAPNADTNPTEWTWRVAFDLNYDGEPVAIAPFSFVVPEYTPGPDPENPDEGSSGLVDLTLVSPVPASNGEAVVRGLSVVGVSLVGDALVFELDNGEELDPVTVPQIEAAQDAADAAALSESNAESAAAAAAAAVNSFDLTIGTVTTGDPGDPADASVSGGPPAWTLDLTLPKGDTGEEGPPAPDATDSVKGIIQLAGDLGGTAASPTVPGLAGKADTVHTHTATDISDSTSVGRSVLTAANAGAARTAIGAGTSSLTLGTTGGTACEGNDARLSDARTPTAAGQAYDVAFVAQTGTRATGAGNVLPHGIKLQRAVRFTRVIYRGNTADASGNTTIELRRNGAQVSGTEKTVAAADQTAGGANATNTGTWDFDEGDILSVQVTAVGTTPGNGLVADIRGVTR